jgi:hypothetical protein
MCLFKRLLKRRQKISLQWIGHGRARRWGQPAADRYTDDRIDRVQAFECFRWRTIGTPKLGEPRAEIPGQILYIDLGAKRWKQNRFRFQQKPLAQPSIPSCLFGFEQHRSVQGRRMRWQSIEQTSPMTYPP